MIVDIFPLSTFEKEISFGWRSRMVGSIGELHKLCEVSSRLRKADNSRSSGGIGPRASQEYGNNRNMAAKPWNTGSQFAVNFGTICFSPGPSCRNTWTSRFYANRGFSSLLSGVRYCFQKIDVLPRLLYELRCAPSPSWIPPKKKPSTSNLFSFSLNFPGFPYFQNNIATEGKFESWYSPKLVAYFGQGITRKIPSLMCIPFHSLTVWHANVRII